MSETGSIYALVDPRDDVVRYVGQTIGALEKRLIEHYTAPRTAPMRDWVQELRGVGLKPVIRLLEDVPRECLNVYEEYWIAEMAYRGFYLLNSRLGPAAVAAYIAGRKPERPQ